MNAPSAESSSEALLFAWDSPGRAKLAILFFLISSFVAHALCFYVFQVVYPPVVSLLPPPGRITLITPDSEEGRSLLRWIDAEDPALAFKTYRPATASLIAPPKTQHVPSYSAIVPTFKTIPSLQRDLPIPSGQPPGAVRFARPKTSVAMPLVKTSITFSRELDIFGAPTLPEANFAASNDETPRSSRFWLGVNKFGEVQYCFPMSLSGDPALDEQGRLYVLRCRFPRISPAGDPYDSFLTWGTAAIQWGSDITRPRPQSRATVTP